ncbi:glycine cleavage system P-protein [Chytridium lagenaria]|nr:glycine cleavage system P-protein [Chytridium lagenaria]
MVEDLTGLPIANASLLDEGTAAAEAMLICFSAYNRKKDVFFVDEKVFPQTIECIKTRAQGFGIKVVVGKYEEFDFKTGGIDGRLWCARSVPQPGGHHSQLRSVRLQSPHPWRHGDRRTDLLACTLLKPPGEWGADIAFGNSQRFGVPLGYGGPHAAFFAVKDEHKRRMPGRLIGVSKDAEGKMAYRLALQTREQHIGERRRRVIFVPPGASC